MILVTGGTGLVGSHLLFELTKTETQVRALFRSEKKIATVKHVFSYYTKDVDTQFSKIDWIQGDINDIPSLENAFKDITHVYHCAALVSFNPDDYYKLRKVNIEGTANIVNLCIDNEIEKVCYVSSIAAIGNELNNNIITEKTSWNPEESHSVYAITKYGAELEVWRGTQEGLDCVIVNPGIILGPGYWRGGGSGAIFKRIYKGITYYTSGTSAYIDVFDVIKPMTQLMNASLKNERYILIAENWSFKDFMIKVANSLNVAPPKKEISKFLLNIAWRMDWLRYQFKKKYRSLTKQTVASLTSDSKYDNSKIKDALNYEFTSIDKSIETTSALFLKDVGL